MMNDPRELYRLTAVPGQPGPVLISLSGFMDGGQAGQLAVQHLIEKQAGNVIARFDVDQLIDHRSRRPMITYAGDHYEDYQPLELVVRELSDDAGKTFYLFTGPEPDYQWERFVQAVTILFSEIGVNLALTLHGIPWGAPHTRPIGLTAHSVDPTMMADFPSLHDRMQLPASMEGLLELKLPQAHIRAGGFSVHVPHYLAGSEFPAGAVRLIDSAAEVAELSLAVPDLRSAADEYLRGIDQLVAQNPENAEAIGQMEAAYDAATAGRELTGERPTQPVDESDIPSGDQLAAEFEQFLKDTDKGHKDGGRGSSGAGDGGPSWG